MYQFRDHGKDIFWKKLLKDIFWKTLWCFIWFTEKRNFNPQSCIILQTTETRQRTANLYHNTVQNFLLTICQIKYIKKIVLKCTAQPLLLLADRTLYVFSVSQIKFFSQTNINSTGTELWLELVQWWWKWSKLM